MPISDEMAKTMIARGQSSTPTLTIQGSFWNAGAVLGFFNTLLQSVSILARNGVTIMAGTDATTTQVGVIGVAMQSFLQDEFELLSQRPSAGNIRCWGWRKGSCKTLSCFLPE